MYIVNEHLKPTNDGSYHMPESFRFCKGDKENEFFAWREKNSLIIETTIQDSDLLVKKIKEYERLERFFETEYLDMKYISQGEKLQEYIFSKNLPCWIYTGYVEENGFQTEKFRMKFAVEMKSVFDFWLTLL